MKCMPCGATNHPTNHTTCLVYWQLEEALTNKDPETTSPYYLTDEEWTWGLRTNTTDLPSPPQQARTTTDETQSPETAPTQRAIKSKQDNTLDNANKPWVSQNINLKLAQTQLR